MKLTLTSALILTALIVYSITAYYSVGFYHADEHFQIVEFAGVKSGWNKPENMVWEYHTQIRSTIQPTLAYGLIGFFKVFGITDPYTLAFLLRAITGLLVIFALTFFFKQTKRFIHSSKNPSTNRLLEVLYLGFLLLIWYVPYLGVRFSSETWSAIFLLLAMGCFCSEKKSNRDILLTGILFGISFLFRFQILFAIVGFGIWFLLFNRRNWKDLLIIIAAFLVVFLIGIGIDSWFYGKFIISAWNYFDQNILQHKAAGFGTSPWDYYLNRLFHLPTKLIGTLLFLSLAAALIFRNKQPFIWIILAFIILHSVVGHKEERFLFPIVFFFPFFFIQFFGLMIDYIPKKVSLTLISLFSLGILTTSVVGIPILGTTSAGLGRNGITQFIHENYQGKSVNLIAMPYANPYAPWFLNECFYLDKNVIFKQINMFEELDSTLLKKDKVNLFVTTRFYLDRYPRKENINKLGFKFIKQSVPAYQLKMDFYVREIDDQYVTYLYELKK